MTQHSKHLTSLLFSAGLVVGLGACSTLEKHLPAIGAATSETSGSAAAEGVYYAASPDLPLHRSPGGVIIKRLPQYTKLYRAQLNSGFAHVRVASTGETGWVDNAQLIWRLPKPKSPQQAHEPESQPVAESPSPLAAEPSPQPVEPPPQAAEPSPQPAELSPQPVEPLPQAVKPSPQPVEPLPTSAPAKGTVAPSIFNPY